MSALKNRRGARRWQPQEVNGFGEGGDFTLAAAILCLRHQFELGAFFGLQGQWFQGSAGAHPPPWQGA